jgi:hypothetical protein
MLHTTLHLHIQLNIFPRGWKVPPTSRFDRQPLPRGPESDVSIIYPNDKGGENSTSRNKQKIDDISSREVLQRVPKDLGTDSTYGRGKRKNEDSFTNVRGTRMGFPHYELILGSPADDSSHDNANGEDSRGRGSHGPRRSTRPHTNMGQHRPEA